MVRFSSGALFLFRPIFLIRYVFSLSLFISNGTKQKYRFLGNDTVCLLRRKKSKLISHSNTITISIFRAGFILVDDMIYGYLYKLLAVSQNTCCCCYLIVIFFVWNLARLFYKYIHIYLNRIIFLLFFVQ